jgi:hypothetical protein
LQGANKRLPLGLAITGETRRRLNGSASEITGEASREIPGSRRVQPHAL